MPSKKKQPAKKPPAKAKKPAPPKKQSAQLQKKNLTLLFVLLGLVGVLFVVGMLRVHAG